VRTLDLVPATVQRVQAAVPAFEHAAAPADREVLPGVEPAPDVHVEVLDASRQPVGGVAGEVEAVRGGGVVHEDPDRPAPQHGDRRARGAGSPAGTIDDRRRRGGLRGIRPEHPGEQAGAGQREAATEQLAT